MLPGPVVQGAGAPCRKPCGSQRPLRQADSGSLGWGPGPAVARVSDFSYKLISPQKGPRERLSNLGSVCVRTRACAPLPVNLVRPPQGLAFSVEDQVSGVRSPATLSERSHPESGKENLLVCEERRLSQVHTPSWNPRALGPRSPGRRPTYSLTFCPAEKSEGGTADWLTGRWGSPGQEQWGPQGKVHPEAPTEDDAGLLGTCRGPGHGGCPRHEGRAPGGWGRPAQGHRNQRRR